MTHHTRFRQTLFAVAAATVALGSAPVLAQDSLSDEDLKNRATAREQTRARQLEADAVARANMAAFETRVVEADRQLSEFKSQHDAFAARLGEIMQNDLGRRIAVQNHQAGLVIMDWMDAPLMRESDFNERRVFADAMVRVIAERKERPDVPFSVEPQQRNRTDDVYLWARERASRLAERRAWLDDTIRSVDDSQPVEGVATLAEAIEAFRKARRDLWAQAASTGKQLARQEAEPQMTEAARIAELEKLLQETEQRLREARQEIEIERMQFESRLSIREAEAIKAAAEAEEARLNLLAETEHMQRLEAANRRLQQELVDAGARDIVNEAESVRLRQLAQSPSVQRDLAPFLARGTWQPNQRAGQQGSAAPGPISFSALMEVGALVDDQQGLMQLLAVANAQGCAGAKSLIHWHQNNRHQDRERTKWGYPRQFRSLTAADQDEVRRIQKLLNELGPTLVDLGLLAP
jgi:hypothetical protein